MGASDDPRNRFTAASATSFRLFVLAVIVAGALLLALLAQRLEWSALLHPHPALVLVVGLVLVGELRPVFTAGGKDADGLLVTNAFLFAVLLRFGVEVTVLVQAVVTTVVDLSRRKAVWRTAFNVGQYTLSWSAAGAVVSVVGRSAQLGQPLHLTGSDLVAALGGAIAYFVCNQVLVVRAVALKNGEPFWTMLHRGLAYESLTNGALLALAPLIAVAMESGVAFVPLLLLPLYAVYQMSAFALEREQEASSDILTGLPNRKRLGERCDQALREQPDGRVGLVLFDLDRFKEVNDTLGHHVGDELLKVVGRRLAAAVREGDSVARLGGDEFAMLLPGVADVETARRAARRMAEIIAAPIVLEGLLIDVGVSVGVAVSPDHGGDLDVLLQRADVAMYLAKDNGGDVEVYDASRDRNTTGRLAMLGELRRAIGAGQLVLHYQPKGRLADGSVLGVEALVRWQHPARGLVPPDEFIPVAERSDVMPALTAWVLEAALTQAARWRDEGFALRVAVNVSARDLCDDSFAGRVAAGLMCHDLPPALLQLEVTEGSFLADPVRALVTMHKLESLGVALSLDDFGTGYSSLEHLRQLPVSEIKIDRSFVSRMDADGRDHAIVRSMIDLASGLGMDVVAEGVETARVWQQLAALGCDYAQGWYLQRGLPAAELTAWLVSRTQQLPAVS